MRCPRLLFTLSALLLVTPLSAQDFRRGDPDGDGVGGTIGDVIYGITYFVPSPGCWDAADADDNGFVDLGDFSYLLFFAAGQGPPPPAPGPYECGPDPTDDDLDCDTYVTCGEPAPPAVVTGQVFRLPDAIGASGTTIDVAVRYDNTDDEGIWAYSLGVCHDPDLASVADVFLGAAYPEEPLFVHQVVDPDGWSIIVISSLGISNQVFGLDQEVAVASYDLLGSGTSPLDFCDTLGDPPVHNVATYTGPAAGAFQPLLESGSIAIDVAPNFLRGDANDSGVVDIADGLYILNNLFAAGPPPLCEDAADVNDDGVRSIPDAIFLLNALFVPGSPEPPTPGLASCGPDPTEDSMVECESTVCP